MGIALPGKQKQHARQRQRNLQCTAKSKMYSSEEIWIFYEGREVGQKTGRL